MIYIDRRLFTQTLTSESLRLTCSSGGPHCSTRLINSDFTYLCLTVAQVSLPIPHSQFLLTTPRPLTDPFRNKTKVQ